MQNPPRKPRLYLHTLCVSFLITLLPQQAAAYSCVRFPSHSSNNHAFMVDRCRPGWAGDSSVSSLCNGDAQETGDPLLLVPVTQRRTGVTYRNGFCAACNDETDLVQNVFWHVRLASSSKEIAESSVSDLRFDPEVSSWVIPDGDALVEIFLLVEPPAEIAGHVTTCQNGLPEIESVRLAPVERLRSKRPLSFALLLDVNTASGDEVGQDSTIQLCPDGGAVWDPFFKKCRVLRCVLPGHVIGDGKCVVEDAE